MAKLQLKNLNKTYSPKNVPVKDISLDVSEGEFLTLLGPSGCGKSTLLRIIAGLETATSGHIYIGDRLVDRVPARQRDVAMVFQNYALYPHMTVAENLGFGMQMRGVDRSIIQQRIVDVAKSLQIDSLLDRYPKQLSGGQQQRVALGRAIARSPQVFLLDEPLSNLDAGLRDNTRTELRQLHHQVGITTIYVTHDYVEAMTLADRIVVLDRGYIQQIGTPSDIYHHPANQMVATFIGTPPMNIIPAIYHNQCWNIGTNKISCPSELATQLQLRDGQGLNLGIRPEHLTIGSDSHPDTLLVTVRSIETLGRETLLKAQIDGTSTPIALLTTPTSTTQSSNRSAPNIGERLGIKLDPHWLFIFDPITGRKLFPSR